MTMDAAFVTSLNKIFAFKELKNIIVKEFGSDAADDDRISRFLRARDFDVRQGYTMLKKNLEWRRKYKIDTILQDFQISEVFAKYFTVNHIGFDKQDSPVILVNFGKLDYKGFCKAFTKGENIRHCIYYLERWEQTMREHSKAIGKPVNKLTVIGNLEEFSFAKMSSKTVIEYGIEGCLLFEANYPERLKTYSVVNAPTSFRILYNLLKSYVSFKTLQKIKIYGKDDWKEELLRYIDSRVLPAYLGGDRTDPDGNSMCYSIVCHGGLVPDRFYMTNTGKGLRNQGGVNSVVLNRRSKLNLPFDVEDEGSVIKWEFETDHYDVGFGLFYKHFNTAVDDDEQLSLIPLQRFDSYMLCEGGAYTCEMPGIYILTLDNSYSFLRSKKIYYKVLIIKQGEVKSDLLE